MGCSISALREKEVIDIRNGKRIGYAYDFRVDVVCGQLTALVLPACGHGGGKKRDLLIPWDRVVRIGDDAILVNVPPSSPCQEVACPPKKRFFGLF